MTPSPDTCAFCFLIFGKETPGTHEVELDMEVTAKFCEEHNNKFDIMVFNKLAKRILKEPGEE